MSFVTYEITGFLSGPTVAILTTPLVLAPPDFPGVAFFSHFRHYAPSVRLTQISFHMIFVIKEVAIVQLRRIFRRSWKVKGWTPRIFAMSLGV